MRRGLYYLLTDGPDLIYNDKGEQNIQSVCSNIEEKSDERILIKKFSF